MKQPEIILYTVTWCPHCQQIVSFLNSLEVDYKNLDVEESDDVWQDSLKLTGGADMVPVIKIGEHVRFGPFNSDFQNWIEQKL